jgi:formylglycine-generating enzyme required for sulfatase activity
VQQVSWFDAVLFCNWLSEKEGGQPCYKRTGEKQKSPYEDGQGKEVEWDVWGCDFDANGYRLPTEAEWEYACRARTTSVFGFGDDDSLVPRYGFFVVNSRSRTWPGGTLVPNNWGLFDIHGNVWEWCWDSYAESAGEGVKADPQGPATGERRVLRGGSWDFYPRISRSAARGAANPDLHTGSVSHIPTPSGFVEVKLKN